MGASRGPQSEAYHYLSMGGVLPRSLRSVVQKLGRYRLVVASNTQKHCLVNRCPLPHAEGEIPPPVL
jgi:hypothetical protein